MKKIFGVTCACLLVSIFSSFTATKPNLPVDPKKKFVVVFNANTGFTELGLIQAECDKKGIRLIYKKIEYNEAGRLKALSITVDCRDGFSGSATTDQLQGKTRFGFYRDYTNETKIPFAIGAIEAE